MAFVIKDRVREATSTTGTSAISLGGTSTSFKTFSTYMANLDTTHYAMVHNTADEWEVGLGTWNTGNTLTRTTVLSSSNSDALVNFTSGAKDVFMTYPASKSVYVAPTEIDLAAIEYFYFGWTNKDGGWLVRRQSRVNASTQDANISNNSSHTTLTSAWASRATLGYA